MWYRFAKNGTTKSGATCQKSAYPENVLPRIHAVVGLAHFVKHNRVSVVKPTQLFQALGSFVVRRMQSGNGF
jgi:hypothetical protein